MKYSMRRLNSRLEFSSETNAVNLRVTIKDELLKFLDCYFILTVYAMTFLRKITEADFCSREKLFIVEDTFHLEREKIFRLILFKLQKFFL